MADLDGLRPGPRDHLITRALQHLLQQLDTEFRQDVALDPAEGPERLARHAMAEIARQLTADEDADAQAARVNELLLRIVADEEDLDDIGGLTTLENVAGYFDVGLDEAVLEQVREELEVDEREPDWGPDEDDYREPRDTRDDDSDIDAMFESS